MTFGVGVAGLALAQVGVAPVAQAQVGAGVTAVAAASRVAAGGPTVAQPSSAGRLLTGKRSGSRWRALPLAGFTITQRYRPNRYRSHSGIDMAAPRGTAIGAISPGVVIRTGWMGAAGKAVMVRQKRGRTVLYAHMRSIRVRVGQRVTPKQRIGTVGSTGNSTGPHLHLQVRRANGRLASPVRAMGLTPRSITRYANNW